MRAPSCARPSTSASPTSTSPTTTGLHPDRPRRTSAVCFAPTFSGPALTETGARASTCSPASRTAACTTWPWMRPRRVAVGIVSGRAAVLAQAPLPCLQRAFPGANRAGADPRCGTGRRSDELIEQRVLLGAQRFREDGHNVDDVVPAVAATLDGEALAAQPVHMVLAPQPHLLDAGERWDGGPSVGDPGNAARW